MSICYLLMMLNVSRHEIGRPVKQFTGYRRDWLLVLPNYELSGRGVHQNFRGGYQAWKHIIAVLF